MGRGRFLLLATDAHGVPGKDGKSVNPLDFFILGDWQQLREAGQYVLRGQSPYLQGNFFYPLSTAIWLIAPLSALPYELSVAIWVALSMGSLWLALGSAAPLFWLSYPFLALLRTGQIDAWFVAPLTWLMSDKPRWAGVACALLTLK